MSSITVIIMMMLKLMGPRRWIKARRHVARRDWEEEAVEWKWTPGIDDMETFDLPCLTGHSTRADGCSLTRLIRCGGLEDMPDGWDG